MDASKMDINLIGDPTCLLQLWLGPSERLHPDLRGDGGGGGSSSCIRKKGIWDMATGKRLFWMDWRIGGSEVLPQTQVGRGLASGREPRREGS